MRRLCGPFAALSRLGRSYLLSPHFQLGVQLALCTLLASLPTFVRCVQMKRACGRAPKSFYLQLSCLGRQQRAWHHTFYLDFSCVCLVCRRPLTGRKESSSSSSSSRSYLLWKVHCALCHATSNCNRYHLPRAAPQPPPLHPPPNNCTQPRPATPTLPPDTPGPSIIPTPASLRCCPPYASYP